MNASGLAEGKIDETRENRGRPTPPGNGPAIRLGPDPAYHTTQNHRIVTALSGKPSRGGRRRSMKDAKELSTKAHKEQRRATKGLEDSLGARQGVIGGKESPNLGELFASMRRLQNAAAGSFPRMATKGTITQKEQNDEKRPRLRALCDQIRQTAFDLLCVHSVNATPC